MPNKKSFQNNMALVLQVAAPMVFLVS